MRMWLGGVLFAAGILGCGGGDDPFARATVRPMGAPIEREAGEGRENALPALERALEGDVESSKETFQATAVRNQPPWLDRVQIHPAERIIGGQDVRVVALARDPDGDAVEIRYSWWVNGEEVEETGPVLSTRSLRRGDTVRVRVVAADGNGESQPTEGPLLTVENGAPAISSAPRGAGPDGLFRYQVQAEDPEGDAGLRFSLAKAPRGMTVTALGGLVEWRPAADQAGVHPVQIVVEDPAGGRARQSFELTIAAPPAAPQR
jgi:hypothetical protein